MKSEYLGLDPDTTSFSSLQVIPTWGQGWETLPSTEVLLKDQPFVLHSPCSASCPCGTSTPLTASQPSPGLGTPGLSFRTYLPSLAPNLHVLLLRGPFTGTAHKTLNQQIQDGSLCSLTPPSIYPRPGFPISAKGRSSFPHTHAENHKIMFSPHSLALQLHQSQSRKLGFSSVRSLPHPHLLAHVASALNQPRMPLAQTVAVVSLIPVSHKSFHTSCKIFPKQLWSHHFSALKWNGFLLSSVQPLASAQSFPRFETNYPSLSPT